MNSIYFNAKLIQRIQWNSMNVSLNLFNKQVSQFEFNYWNYWTFPQHSNLLRCACKYREEQRNREHTCIQ